MMTTKHRHFIRRTAVALAIGMLALTGPGMQNASAGTKPAKAAKKQAAAPDAGMVLEQRAMDLLKASSARLAAANSLSFTATVSYEYPSRLGPAIVYTTRYDVAMQRPDKLRVITPGDGPASEFYYDGKTMMAFAPVENLVAVADAPPAIDAMLKQAYEKAAIYYPFTDLIAADPFAALTEGAKLAFYIGPSGMVGGVKTDMVAWANDDVFIQIWIGVDDKLPRRVRAVYSADPLRLRHDMELSNWQIDPHIGPELFGSQKAQAAPRMAFAHPVSAPPPGVKPLMEGKAAKGKAKSSTGQK